jgi:hypothetical protein
VGAVRPLVFFPKTAYTDKITKLKGVKSMGKQAFEEYIDTIQKTVTVDEYQQQELDEWTQYLDVLYDKITEWMQEYVAKDIVQYEFEDKTIYEEFIGEYKVKVLNLTLFGKTIIFNPIGTRLIGAKGRVDVSGRSGKVSLILVDKNLAGPNVQFKIFTSHKERKEYEKTRDFSKLFEIEWEWKVLINNTQMYYVTLDQENFFDMIMGLII